MDAPPTQTLQHRTRSARRETKSPLPSRPNRKPRRPHQGGVMRLRVAYRIEPLTRQLLLKLKQKITDESVDHPQIDRFLVDDVFQAFNLVITHVHNIDENSNYNHLENLVFANQSAQAELHRLMTHAGKK
jgi:hypothetical protein